MGRTCLGKDDLTFFPMTNDKFEMTNDKCFLTDPGA